MAAASAVALQASAVESTDISGTVTSAHGPEAGVWVIAETTELPTRFARIVVTDDKGRYLIPDLPDVNYTVWVRGYGLVDSPKVRANPGHTLDLTAVPAPNEAAAAHYYPAIYWYSMMKLPKAEDFGGQGRIPANVTQREYLSTVKNIGCVGCHQLGQESTRTLPAAFSHFKTGEEAWMRRVMSGQSGEQMIGIAGRQLGGAPFQFLGEWTDRVAKGDLPRVKPRRPEGAERNIVVTWWEWGQPEKYLHDLISSDRRDPSVNAYGALYGSPEYSTDNMPILDPRTGKVTFFKMPVRDANTPESLGPGHAASAAPLQPSAYWGDAKTWDTKANNHNAMFDRQGRVWLTANVRASDNPGFCKKGSEHPSAKAFPLERNNRQLAILDPKTMKYTFVDTCFGTHHLQFDAQDRLWTSGAPVAAWVDTKVFNETGDAAKAQRWSPFIVDGKTLQGYGTYAVMPNPADGTVWYTARIFAGGGSLLRFDPRSGLSEVFNVPAPYYAPRGADIDKHGVVWASMGSGHLGSFDRRKCKGPLAGPAATGDHCPEGWSFHQYPGPGFEGIGDNSAESSYYTWVDQHDTLGLGEDVPVSTGNLNDGLIAYAGGKMIVLRVPYPMGFYAKGLDGRIDDAKAGWKGRGLWTSSGDRTPWLREGGRGSLPLAVHFQYRPDPLAR